jgi:hypothetical protein
MQGGDMSGRQHFTGKEAAAPTVADVPVLGEEHKTFQQEVESQRGNDPFNVEEEDVDDSNDPPPISYGASGKAHKVFTKFEGFMEGNVFGFSGYKPASKDCFIQ